MKRILRRRPSPALIVACVALFAALGGSAYALTITGKNVKNNSLTGADIRGIKRWDVANYTLTGKDIRRDSLGRVPIKEERLDASKLDASKIVASRLGKVKSAEAADSVGGVKVRRFPAFLLDTGGSRELMRQGPLVLTARCRTDGADQVAEVIVQTAQNGAAVDGAQNDAQLNVGETVQLARAGAPLGTPAFEQADAGVAIAQDGTEILGQDLFTGTSVLGQANKCRFGGVVYLG